jgi:hypothetical protein
MMFLSVIVDQESRATVREYELECNNEPFARWKARQLYLADPKRDHNRDFEVDCIAL